MSAIKKSMKYAPPPSTTGTGLDNATVKTNRKAKKP
jgi:hypothetical protein